ncbi:hypothetical protein PFICI_07850 [Pestalotiopsis fici W106-1]|uniref:Cyanovirin-N domain-containing protein n=1 Tax=Pestalotiopsis fici (strain W106-1 / CGMCC3.15140) TaxID=1229662 RepID=W3X566_PESFW|nr:uncharacterized protein PFICI_07850 [Pestalotiopsis fici W106-1]ETS80321.1 hypothetical protein PFICI_07850 [Pestalotiopsis fici W106-1]
MRSPLAAALLLTSSASLALGQGFYESCFRTWELGYHHNSNFVVARCPSTPASSAPAPPPNNTAVPAAGGNVTSAIDLLDCLKNTEGVLEPGRLGHAFYSCQDCVASTTDATISCQCRNSHNDYLPTSLDLDTVITNNNGILGCFDLPG